MKIVATLLTLMTLSVTGTAIGATIIVNRDGFGDFATIQPALDVAADGDTVLIGPGEYTEWSWVRLPGYGYDIKSFAHLRSDDVTLIGSGIASTVIGPAIYEGSGGTFSPKGITYQVGDGSLYVSDLTVRHCYDGLFLKGTLYMDRCRLENNGGGLFWGTVGAGGWVRDTVLEVTEPIFDPIGFDIGAGGAGSDIVMERCQSDRGATIRGVQGAIITDCHMAGLAVYSGAHVTVANCELRGGNVGISLSLGSSSYCEVYGSELGGAFGALNISSSARGSQYVVENCRLEGGSHGILYSGSGAGASTLTGCDLVKGSGPMVECAPSASMVTHDLRNNYWGTTDEATIQSWITDHSDNPSIGATVLYSPYSGQSVPIESTSWGDLKALFR